MKSLRSRFAFELNSLAPEQLAKRSGEEESGEQAARSRLAVSPFNSVLEVTPLAPQVLPKCCQCGQLTLYHLSPSISSIEVQLKTVHVSCRIICAPAERGECQVKPHLLYRAGICLFKIHSRQMKNNNPRPFTF